MQTRSIIPGASEFTRLYRAMICVLLLCGTTTFPAQAQVDLGVLRTWGLATYAEINRTLRVAGTQLFAETATLGGVQCGGLNGRAYVWPVSTQFRVFNTLAQIEPTTFSPTLRQFADELHNVYWDSGYRSGAGGGDRYYDDNAHLVVAMVEAYRLTNDSTYLNRAKGTHAFIMQGEDSVAGGGIYFQQFDYSSKDAISTLQAARGAAMLFQATNQQSYLNDATRLLTWAQNHIQRADGMFSERWNIATNRAEGFDLVNSAGIGISTNLELFDATGNSAYLAEAQRMASRTLTRYFDSATGRINDEGYWAFELVDALDNLYLHDRNTLWLDKIYDALVWLHDNKCDPYGHYGLFWGREGPQINTLDSWNLNEQASVARAYLYTSATSIPSSDFDGDCDVDGADFLNWQASFGVDAGGDSDGDGDTDGDDLLIWRSQFGSYIGLTNTAVPEPASITLLLVLMVLVMLSRPI